MVESRSGGVNRGASALVLKDIIVLSYLAIRNTVRGAPGNEGKRGLQ